ncbi:leucine-rich repeat flightless-interacting protein 1 isoform X2 [Carassius gibelio]|uniref:leucine-rich repeat flightless-interacting protein 1 isoform X2 n=1 Tax=Carassius gibelio TaxID=101364 RepID=UPI0022781B2C|nr:leucine-rich repeat flightless-interacting protein 1 isoform X2 [Carassius gibelio]
MGSQGPGRRRTPSKNGLTGEEDALNVIAKEAEARLAAKRAARAEAREIRMRELERQQKEIYQVQKKYYGLDNLDNKWGDIEQWMEDSERYTRVSRRHASVSDDEEQMSVGSRSNIRLDLDAAGAYGVLPQASSYHKKSKKKKKHSSKSSNGYDDDLSTVSSRSSRLSDESKISRSSRLDQQSKACHSSELYSSSSYSSKHQAPSYNRCQSSLLHSRKHRGSVYEDSLYSGSRRPSARASSEYGGFPGSSSRTSSRANSACGSPVEDCSSSVASFMRSSASISGLSRDLDHVVIPDLPNVNGRLSMADDRLERDYLEKGSSRASTISGATLTSLGGTSSRRGSGDTAITADTEASIREIKDSLLEVEEKYRKAMVSNAQLDNEKTNMMYEVDTLKDSLMELEEMLFETRRELEEKCKDLEREKHAHSILQFQFSELKETLKQSEELLTEIRQLRLKQDGNVREISDLQETIEWKNKKIGALERQKEFSDAIRNERDELRDEVVQLKDILKKHGIVLGLDLATNGETDEVGKADQNSQTASAEIREGSSVLGTHQLKVCKDQQQKDLDDGVPGNQQISAELSSTNAPLEANEIGDLGDQMNQGVEQLENRPKEPPSSVGDDELTATRPTEQIKSEAHIPEDSRANTEELECIVHKDGHLETDQQESECVKLSQVIKEETPLESVSGSVHDEPDKPGQPVLDDELKEEPAKSSQTEKLAKTQGASASNKKKKRKKKNKQKQKQSDKQEIDTKIDDKTKTVCSEDNPNQKTEGDLEGNNQEPLGNDVSQTTMNTDVPPDAKRTSELDGIKTTSANIHADEIQDKIRLVTDEADLAGISKTISNFDCPESSNGIISDDLSSKVISNPANIIERHTEDSTNPDSEAVDFSCELVSSETETSLPREPAAQSMDAGEGGVESISCSENIERSSSIDMKEVKSHLNCEVEEQEVNVQNTDIDGTTNPEYQDDSAHPSSSVKEKVENEAERVIQEPSIDQPMENQLQDSIGAELEQEEVERRDDLDKENLKAPTEKVSDTQESIVSGLDQEEVERQDDLDKENLNMPTEKVSDTQESIGSGLDQEEVERRDDLDKENLRVPTENITDGSHGDNTPLIETQVQVVHEDHSSPNEAIKESVGESDSSDQEPKVGKDEEERSIQNQLKVQLSKDGEDLLVKSDVAAQELIEEEEEDEGESFDFDEMDLEASSDAPLKNVLDQPTEEGTLFKDDVQEAKQEFQSNVTNEDQTQKEHLELADQESKSKEQKDDGQDTENPQTTTVIQGCLTEDSKISSEVKPNDQQHETSGNKDAFEEHQQASENVTLSKGVNLISEMEKRNVGQEINSSIQHGNKVSSISGDLEVEKETTERNKAHERKESKKSGKGKGKGKGKEECKMS